MFRKVSWAVIWKITLIFVSQPENKVLCHSLFLCLGYPVTLGGMRCGSVGTGTSPADWLYWEGSTTARLLPLHQAAALSAWICPLSNGK